MTSFLTPMSSMTNMWAFALLVTGALWPGVGDPPPAAQCDPARLAEVDFLRGEWMVESVEPGTPPRERSGVAIVSRIAAGCALQERLRLDDGYEAVRILAFDDRSETWQLALVDAAHGNIVFLTGHRVETGLEFITTHQRSSALLVDRVSVLRAEAGWSMRIESARGYGEPWRLLHEIRYAPSE